MFALHYSEQVFVYKTAGKVDKLAKVIYLRPKDSNDTNGNPLLSFILDKNVKDRLITKSKSDIDLK